LTDFNQFFGIGCVTSNVYILVVLWIMMQIQEYLPLRDRAILLSLLITWKVADKLSWNFVGGGMFH